MTGKPIDEAPKAPEAPKPEAPKAPEAPKPEAPKAPEAPKPEAPKVPEAPKPEAPKTPEMPKAPEAPKPEEQGDMVSLDTIMQEVEDNTPPAEVSKPRPHFVRKKTGEKIYITKDEFKIGKSKVHADYAIDSNSAISRVHVIIIRRNGVNYLKDNDSTNGTFVDGEKLEPGREVLLKANMEVKFGDEDFTFLLRD